ncbi:MAG: ABC transporter substrate-binding protein [Pseudomonadota bacterium]
MLKHIALGTAVSALAFTGAVGAASAQDDTLTAVSWGGAYSASQRGAYYEPYTAKTGVKILEEDKSNQALAGIRSQVEAGNVTWDVVDMLQSDAQRACDEGLILEIDWDRLAKAPDGTSSRDDFVAETTGDCFVPQILYATLFAYNTEAFDGKDAPASIADVFDVATFPGTRAFEKIPQKNLEWALLADGVSPGEVYDVLATQEGQDRAFAKLDSIKDSIIWWDAGAQPPQLLADGEVTIASAYNGRIFNAQVNEDQPFKIIWDGQMFEADGWVVPVDTGKEDMIYDFLNFATDTQRLADQTKFIAYAPARKSSIPLIGTHEASGVEMMEHMPTAPENFDGKAIRFNVEFWADYGDSLEERFNAWLSS